MAGSGQNDGDKIDVSYVANLARLHLTEEETERFQGQLEQIVGYVKKISDLDVSGVEPTSHAWPVQNVFRADDLRSGLNHDEVMENAPQAASGQFVVPKIVE
jgi:aspartyl-tRNA(Asn)/glutamyl-tRNA(Gln) amidotransferase subunit C